MNDELIRSLIPDRGGVGLDSFRDVTNAAYQVFMTTGAMPTVDSVHALLPGKKKHTIASVMASPGYKSSMHNRGVRIQDSNALTAEQGYVLSMLMDPSDRRTFQKKLKAANVPYSRYRAWMKEPYFSSRMNQLSESALKDHQGDVLVAMTSEAMDGNVAAIKMFLEVTGRHDPKRDQQINMQAFLMTIIEILTTHVQDPGTLAAIAQDMQARGLTGGTVGGSTGMVVQGEVSGGV